MSKTDYLDYDSEGDSEETTELCKDFLVQCYANAMTAGLVIDAADKMFASRKKDRESKAKAKQLVEGRVIDTPPPLKLVPHLGAAGGLKRDEVGVFSAEMFSLSKIPKEKDGDFHSNTGDDGAWSKSDENHPDTGVAGDKNAKMKGSKDDTVEALFGSSESSPGAGTPSTEDGGEEDDILETTT
jgi:hypothetical protein